VKDGIAFGKGRFGVGGELNIGSVNQTLSGYNFL